MWKTSFNGLKVVVDGIYSVYNLTFNDLKDLERKFGSENVNGSGGNYTVFRDHDRKVVLSLFVHGIWKPISFDVRKDFLELFESKRIFTKNIEIISKELKERRICLHVDFNPITKTWYIIGEDYEGFLNLVKQIINSL